MTFYINCITLMLMKSISKVIRYRCVKLRGSYCMVQRKTSNGKKWISDIDARNCKEVT
jgi:hypothetical protein